MRRVTLPVVIVEYDPAWPTLYEEARAEIVATIGQWIVGVEHVGSTAVPGLASKPIIDIMIAIPRLADAVHTVEPLAGLGYEYIPEFEDVMPERRYFRRMAGEAPTHHIHMVEPGSDFWVRHIDFRDYLRGHPEVAAEYAALKQALAAQYGSNRDGYTEAKTEFIRGIEHIAAVAREASHG